MADRVTEFLDELRAVVGNTHVLVDRDQCARYEIDWTGRFRGTAAAVLRPRDTSEVAQVLAACTVAGVAVVPQGGNTGLVGGGVPLHGEVVVSLERLVDLDPPDPLAAQVTVGAGVTLANLQSHVRASGFEFAVDFGARDSATIGGMTATNAGGARAFRYGSMRQQLAGFEAVLANGSVVSRLDGLLKDNAGYDLAPLLAGSEGTLAVITRARLRLHPLRAHRASCLLAFTSFDDLVAAFVALRAALPSLDAAEFMTEKGVQLVCDHAGLAPPLGQVHPAYLLVECADSARPPIDELAEGVAALGAVVVDEAVGVDPTQRRQLWQYRERHTEAVNALGVPHKFDVAVPLASLAAYIRTVDAAVTQLLPDAQVFLFGHAGDGNVHVNVVADASDHVGETLAQTVLTLATQAGGTISAEHGVGAAKRHWLGLQRSPTDMSLCRALKYAFDPAGVLNPNVLFEPNVLSDIAS